MTLTSQSKLINILADFSARSLEENISEAVEIIKKKVMSIILQSTFIFALYNDTDTAS
jgi:hypothetical protein